MQSKGRRSSKSKMSQPPIPWARDKDPQPRRVAPPDLFETGDDYCKLCYTESLENAPCVALDCGHVIHARCALKRLQVGQVGHRLTFRYLQCHEPGCNGSYASLASACVDSPMSIMSVAATARSRLREWVVSNALKQWPLQLKHDADSKPGGRFHGRKQEHAMAKLAFYLCSSCSCPFFGGRAECGDALDEENEDDARNVAVVDKDNKLLCPSCMGPRAGVKSCPRHGNSGMQMKVSAILRMRAIFQHNT